MESLRKILSIISEVKPNLIKKYSIKTIGIFGSYTRGDFTPDSDIDILVEFERPVGIEFIDLANELESILHHKVDLVSKAGVKPNYLKTIEKDLLYV